MSRPDKITVKPLDPGGRRHVASDANGTPICTRRTEGGARRAAMAMLRGGATVRGTCRVCGERYVTSSDDVTRCDDCAELADDSVSS